MIKVKLFVFFVVILYRYPELFVMNNHKDKELTFGSNQCCFGGVLVKSDI